MPAAACTACAVARSQPKVWAQVLAGRAKTPPTTYRVISQWLATHRLAIRPWVLRDHFLFHKGDR